MSTTLQENSRAVMAAGSQSFDFAAKALPEWQREGARYLYVWCRHCDDEVDNAPTLEQKLANVAKLEEQTKLSWIDTPEEDLVFRAFGQVCSNYQIPKQYALDLLAGMRADAEGKRYQTLADLEVYCYQVAGTVGLMMCHVMGLSHSRALDHAVDLGIAMQLTNISRDVGEDFAQGRVFLPLDWLRESGIPENDLMNPRYREALVGLVNRLLEHARAKYASGDRGLRYLHWRSALAIRVASGVYSGIGREVSSRGPAAWDRRCYTTKFTKLKLALGAAFRSALEIPFRATRPWAAKPIDTLWRPQ
ncbi:MAG: phytoene/squalene synthase family protein [Proteobacteria bacterium]|nr:MAG: phytoene/squalene synthase family protein [Pseudomonadota bacterium]